MNSNQINKIRMTNLLRFLEDASLPSNVIPIFHSKKTIVKTTIRFPFKADTAEDVLQKLHSYFLLVVLFDDNNTPSKWKGVHGSAIASIHSLGNDKSNNKGRWFLHNYAARDCLSSLRDLNNKETEGLFEDEDASLKQFIERCKA